jgi:DNA-binding NarL/FixJ family response regulator
MTEAIATDTIGVLLAEDHDLVRSGLKALLHTMQGIHVIGEVRDGDELVAYIDSGRPLPDLVVTDLSMPRMCGLEAIQRLRARYPDLRILVLSMYDTADFVKEAVARGANGYVMKGASSEELEHAIHAIVNTGSYFGRAVAQRLLQQTAPRAQDELTPRQVQIVTMLTSGLSSKEVAHELGLSSKTIDVHRARIMERLGLSDMTSLTRYAVRKGLVKA